MRSSSISGRWVKALTVTALACVIIASVTVAYGAINKNGVVKTCYNTSTKVWRLVDSTVACATGETTLQFYTKTRVDALLADRLTQATADALYLPLTNCIGYPHRGIDWSGCNLESANLAGAVFWLGDVSTANLADAKMSSANLRGVVAHGTTFEQASMTGALMEDGDFTGASFKNANLTNAVLTGDDLTNADLTGATMTGANVGLVTWGNTTCPDGTNSDSNGDTCVGHLA